MNINIGYSRGQMSSSNLPAPEPVPDLQETNQILEEDTPFHQWYQFVLSFPPHIVRHYLGFFDASEDSVILDPFCGTGTTLVESKKLGFRSQGIEANPMAQFASKVKVNWKVDVARLGGYADDIEQTVLDILQGQGIEDNPALYGVDTQSREMLSLPPQQQKLLVKNSMSAMPMHKTLVLLDRIRTVPDDDIRDCFLLALASTAVQDSSNLRFGPEVGVGVIRPDAPVIGPWRRRVKKMERDLAKWGGERAEVSSQVTNGDARDIDQLLGPQSINIVITSPPYPNEKDYSRTTRLESVLLGFMETKKELRQIKKGFVRSNTRGVYKGDKDHEWIGDIPIVEQLCQEIERRRIELGKTSGFERAYHRVTRQYFGGMARHLANLRETLQPGARLAYVVGDQASYLRVMIRTGRILAEIAESQGFEIVGLDLFRTRFATATGEQLNEEVVLLRWPG
jgi:hypothetical protein